ncbi:recombinase family protein [Microbacterium pumilum]|uniref:Resolvase/invertase-type recombinase catalytic domain-containing protein n=1 Tax=Microbacterium pumilum TaxID=344165 RepID=A0ABN2S2V2_9MICO
MTRVVGYTRPIGASDDTNADAEHLRSIGPIDIYLEAPGVAAQEMLAVCIGSLVPGDELVVSSSARLSPTLTQFVSTVAELSRRGILYRSLSEPALSTASGQVASTDVLPALDSLRRELLGLRTRKGMADAAASGKRPGRPSVMTPERVALAHELRERGRSFADIGHELGVSASAVRRALL